MKTAVVRAFGLFASVLVTVSSRADEGTVVCWGMNTTQFPVCTVPPGLAGVTQIAASYPASIALLQNGTLVAWGGNYWGHLNLPIGLSGVRQVSLGQVFGLALCDDGTVTQWGSSGLPWISLAGINFIDANGFALAVRDSGEVVGWGGDGQGQTRGTNELRGIATVAAGSEFGVALNTQGTVFAWGSNSFGESSVPFNLGVARQIDAGSQFAVALTQDRRVVCWGRNDKGQRNVPSSLTGVREVAAGGQHVLALREDGSVAAWGNNDSGQCNVPPQTTGVTRLAAGDHHSLALLGPRIAIQSVRPISGPSSGGTFITITGTNFNPGARVKIRDADAIDVQVLSPTTITALTPPGFPGEAEVSVDYGFATAFYYRPECGSDLDQSGEVDGGDLAILLMDWGPCYSGVAPATTEDSRPFMLREEAALVAPRSR